MSKYLTEAFKQMNDLDEEVFKADVDGAKKLQAFLDGDTVDEFETIIDPEAETVDDLQDSYIGKIILNCPVCNAKIYKDLDNIIIDDKVDLVNTDEECPFCQSLGGFEVIGQIDKFDVDEEFKDDANVNSDEDINESKSKANLKEGLDINKLAKFIESSVKDLTTEDYGCANSDLAVYVGWSGGWGKELRNDIIQSKENPDYALDCGIRVRNDFDWADFDFLKCPYFEGDGEDLDITYSISPNEDYSALAAQLIKDYEDIKDYEVASDGKLTESKHTTKIGKDFKKVDIETDDTKMLKEGFEDDLVEGAYYRGFIISKAGDKFMIDGFGESYDTYEDAKAGVDSWIEDDGIDPRVLNEDFKKVNIETDDSIMTMDSDNSGKVTVTTEPKQKAEGEVISPISDENKDKILDSDADKEIEEEPELEIEEPSIDVEVDEFSEDDFDELGESYLKKVYENVKSYKTTKGKISGDSMIFEGIITFNSGKKSKTKFMFESSTATKTGKVKFIGRNPQISKNNKAFTITGRIKGGKLVTESFTYNYSAKDANTKKSKKLYGTITKK